MIVVDASVVVDALLGSGSEAGDRLTDVLERGDVVCAPHLVDVEVGQVVRRFEHRGELAGHDAVQAIRDLGDLPLRRYPHHVLLPRTFDLRHNVTLYDAVYLALAEALEVPLLTGDRGLADVPACTATVEVVTTTG